MQNTARDAAMERAEEKHLPIKGAGPFPVPSSSLAAALRQLGVDQEAKLIEFDVETTIVARSLAACGYNNFLGLVPDAGRLAALRTNAPEIASHLQLMRWPSVYSEMRFHNADVMILSGMASSYLRLAIGRSYVRTILWRVGSPRQGAKALLWALYKGARGAVRPLGSVEFRDGAGRHTRYWAVQRLAVQTIDKPRRYIDPRGGLPAFFRQLDEEAIRYVVLRWFEDLPHEEPGEDIDLLVADEDLPKLSSILDSRPGNMPCDIYTSSGLPGTASGDIPYYPPHVADEIIGRRVRYGNQFYVPCPEHHFLSLAYHAVYHKGEASGLRTGGQSPEVFKEPDHDYGEALSQLAQQLGETINPTLPSLHKMLQKRGWTPETDTLRKLSLTNRWIETLLPTEEPDPANGELIVFVIREWATSRGLVPEIERRLAAHGLKIITVRELDSAEQQIAARKLRGGKWGAAHPGQPSGGRPAALVVAFDPAPMELSPNERAKYPHVRNVHVLVKHTLREEMNAGLPLESRPNFIHSADDEIEAWEYLESACPSVIDEVRLQLSRLRSDAGQPASVC